MSTIGAIRAAIDQWAPPETAEGYDNVGLLIGDDFLEVTRCLVTLDVTQAACDEAAGWGAELILSHHPVIFDPIKRISSRKRRQRHADSAAWGEKRRPRGGHG